LLGAICGAATVLIALATFTAPHVFTTGWNYAADNSTVAIALAGYAILFLAILAILALRRASRASDLPSRTDF
jgi:hypothetical protein